MAKSGSFATTLTVLIVFAGLGTGGYFYWKKADAKPPEVISTTVTRGDVIQIITATGVLQSPTNVDVSSQISGQVREVYADYNQVVKKGDVLARIDPATYESKMRQAEANLASITANNSLVRINTERTRELRAKNLVSQQELDQAEAQFAQANAQLLTANATVEDARVNLSRCTITAPIDGVVLDRLTEVGKTVAASLNAPTLFTLVNDLTKMQISADVAEADIGNIAADQEVTFLVDAYPGRTFNGRVKQIRNLPKTQQSVVVYGTIIEVNNSDQKLKPGMTANVSIITARRTGVLKIANASLRARIPEKYQPAKPEAAKADKPSSGSTAAAAPTGERPRSPEGASSGSGAGSNRREQFRQLMQDAGVTFTPGQPLAPADVEKLKKLAAERGIEIPERMLAGGSRSRSAESAVTTRTLYRLTSPAPAIVLEAVSAKLGISDGSSTEVIDGLKEGDTIVSSITIPGDTSAAAGAARNPFGGNTGMPGMGGGRR